MQPGFTPVPPPAVPPVPVRKASGAGCAIWGLVGCGVLVIIIIIAVVVAGFSLAKSKAGKGLVSGVVASQSCSRNLWYIRRALNEYRTEHDGKYPRTLAELSSRYLSDPSAMTCSEGGTRAQYTPPGPQSPPDAPVVSFHTGEWSLIAQQKVVYEVRLLRDGRIVYDQVTQQELYPPG